MDNSMEMVGKEDYKMRARKKLKITLFNLNRQDVLWQWKTI